MKSLEWNATIGLLRFISSLIFVGLLTIAALGKAQSLDRNTTTDLIQRFEQVQANLPNDERVNVLIRLADLYAERARLSDIDAGNPQCKNCKNGRADRQKAIFYYESVLPKIKDEQAQTILLQLGHVYTLNGHPRKAEELYLKIVNHPQKYHASMVGQSYVGLADLAITEKKYNKAKNLLDKSLNADPETDNWAVIQRKISWCYFNLGQINKAQDQASEVLERGKTTYQTHQPAAPIFIDMARDYATFLAHGSPTSAQIDQLAALAPPGEIENLFLYFGDETIRLGKMQAALQVWSRILRLTKNNDHNIRARVQLANVYFNLDQKDAVIHELQKIQLAWAAQPCQDVELCEENQLSLRALLLNWHKKERKKPTPRIAQAFAIYTKIFPSDLDRLVLAASLAQQIGDFRSAFMLFRQSGEQCRILMKDQKNERDAKLRAKLSKQHEEVLVAAVEVAEKSRDFKLREVAYADYITYLPGGGKAELIRYQIAHLAYEMKDYTKAADLFIKIAKDAKFSESDLRLKSAHLSIDSLVLLKRDEDIQAHSLDYARLFPKAKVEFLSLHRVSTQKLVQVRLRESPTDREKLATQLLILKRSSLVNATHEEQVAHWRLVVEAAKKIQDLDTVRLAAHQILRLKKLTQVDRSFAFACIAWVEELRLNFLAAYRALQQNTGGKEEQKHLKLATLAELAGIASEKHYLDFLRTTSSRQDANVVRAKLILRDRNPVQRFQSYSQELKKNPSLAGDLALDVYGKTSDRRFADWVLADRVLRNTWGAQIIARDLRLAEFDIRAREMRSLPLRSGSLEVMGADLQKRIERLTALEQILKQAIRARDWTLQIVYSDLIASEKRRLYSQLMSLRAPRGLPAAQRPVFLQQIQNQARPFLKAAEDLETQLITLWSSSSEYLKPLATNLETVSHQLRRPLYRREVSKLLSVAPESYRDDVRELLDKTPPMVGQQEFMIARQKLSQEPFSEEHLTNLVELAEKRREETLVQYLLARKVALEKGAPQ